MITVIGLAASGKSEVAEKIAVNIALKHNKQLIYLATMESESAASKERIKKHRNLRKDKGFITIEEQVSLNKHVNAVKDKVVLLECVSNLCANYYYNVSGENTVSDESISLMADDIFNDILSINDSAFELILVTNDMYRDGIIYDEWTESYLKLTAKVNSKSVEHSESFFEVINGISIKIQGISTGNKYENI